MSGVQVGVLYSDVRGGIQHGFGEYSPECPATLLVLYSDLLDKWLRRWIDAEVRMSVKLAMIHPPLLSAQWCNGTNPAYRAGGTEFKSRSHHKRYSFARVA